MRNIALAMLCKAIRLYASEHTTGTIIFSAQSLASMKGASRPITTTNPPAFLRQPDGARCEKCEGADHLIAISRAEHTQCRYPMPIQIKHSNDHVSGEPSWPRKVLRDGHRPMSLSNV